VRLISITNGGPGRAREAGRKAARGEYVQYLDSDDVLSETKLERQVKALEENPDCDFSLCGTAVIDCDGTVVQAGVIDIAPKGRLFPSLLNSRWWQTSTPLYRRQILDRAGPWPKERLYEDWQYEARVAALGTQYCFVADVLAMFRRHESHRLRDCVKDRELRAKDFGIALERVYGCAKRAGVSSKDPEMLRFVHTLLRTSRDCSENGLRGRAWRLFSIALRESLLSGRPGLIALTMKRAWRNVGGAVDVARR
jgi:glycosyltransferase involved in cell wall biosynthesis